MFVELFGDSTLVRFMHPVNVLWHVFPLQHRYLEDPSFVEYSCSYQYNAKTS